MHDCVCLCDSMGVCAHALEIILLNKTKWNYLLMMEVIWFPLQTAAGLQPLILLESKVTVKDKSILAI